MDTVKCNEICSGDQPSYSVNDIRKYASCNEIKNFLGDRYPENKKEFEKNSAYAATVMKSFCNQQQRIGGNTSKKQRRKRRNTKKRNRRSNKKKIISRKNRRTKYE